MYLCGIPVFIFALLYFGLLFVNFQVMAPTIIVRESGLKVVTLLGASPWLDWSDNKKATKVNLTGGGYWKLEIEGLGRHYRQNERFIFSSAREIRINRTNVTNHEELIRILKQKRPDLMFNPPTRNSIFHIGKVA